VKPSYLYDTLSECVHERGDAKKLYVGAVSKKCVQKVEGGISFFFRDKPRHEALKSSA
jgi:hypothetical protein